MAEIIGWLRRVPLFKGLSTSSLKELAAIAEKRTCDAGALLFREGESGEECFVLLSGQVRIFKKHDDQEKTITYFREGDCFGELALLDGEPRSASAETTEASILFTISRENFMDLLQRHFHLTQAIMRELSTRLRKANEHAEELVFLDAKTRVIKTLINLAKEHGKRDGDLIMIDMRFNREDLSRLAGISKYVVDQVLEHLTRKRVIMENQGRVWLNMSQIAR